jgi:DNA-binding LytR/AlgR family response regulator
MKINCVICDSLSASHEGPGIVEDYLKSFPDFKVVARCKNAFEVFSLLRALDVDVLFISIEMPEMNGLDLIRSLTKTPLIVFTTASAEFAIDGFDLNAVDYLVKPIQLDRFIKTIDKIYQRLTGGKQAMLADDATISGPKNNFIFIKAESGLIRIDYDAVLYIEGLENYIKIVCENKTVVTLLTMKAVESLISSGNFLRIHRSYIVNMNKVESINDGCFNMKGKSIVIGRSYKKVVQSVLKNKYSLKSTLS